MKQSCDKVEHLITENLNKKLIEIRDKLNKIEGVSNKNELLLTKAWTCLNSIVDLLKGANLIQRLSTIRQTIRMLTKFHLNQSNRFYSVRLSGDDSEMFANTPLLPGFCLPKKGKNFFITELSKLKNLLFFLKESHVFCQYSKKVS